MTLVTSMMTAKELADSDIIKASKIIEKALGFKTRVQKYKFDNRKYYEVDIDLLDVSFAKQSLYLKIDKLISAYERIIETVSAEIEFIAANDDTETEILRYERDRNDVFDFGLFVAKRRISGAKPYYSSRHCHAYLNLTHVSFGVY